MDYGLINIDFLKNINLIFNYKLWIPENKLDSIVDIKESHLINVKGIIFDIDQTIVPYGQTEIPKDILDFINTLKLKYKCCLLSNYPINSNSLTRINSLENTLGIKVVLTSKKKPDPRAYYAAISYLNLNSNEVLMVGDRILTDIIGANNCNINTLLVKPIDSRIDPILWVTIPRYIENFIASFLEFVLGGNNG
jgi:hypothetical protein